MVAIGDRLEACSSKRFHRELNVCQPQILHRRGPPRYWVNPPIAWIGSRLRPDAQELKYYLQIAQTLDISKVDFSKVLRGGKFDNGGQIRLEPKPNSRVAESVHDLDRSS